MVAMKTAMMTSETDVHPALRLIGDVVRIGTAVANSIGTIAIETVVTVDKLCDQTRVRGDEKRGFKNVELLSFSAPSKKV